MGCERLDDTGGSTGGHDHQQNGYTIVYTDAASNEKLLTLQE